MTHLLTDKDRDRVIELTQCLIRIESDSIGTKEIAIGNFIYDFLNDLGIAVLKQYCNQDRFNVLAQVDGIDDSHTIMYLGHLDTVPIGDEVMWSVPPLSGEVVGDRMYGRGASDMKGSIACTLFLLEYIKKNNIIPKHNIFFLYDVDEENENLGLKTFLQSPRSVDFIVVGEPTNLTMCVGHRGVMGINITIEGESAHVGVAQQGINSIYAACSIANEVKKLNKSLSKNAIKYLGSPSVHLTKIRGGNKINVIPEQTRIWIDRRLVSGEDPQSCVDEIKTIVDKICFDELCENEIAVTTYSPSWSVDLQHSYLKNLANLMEKFELDSNYHGFKASCEAGMMVDVLQVPAVILGPGDIQQAHANDEYIDIDQLIKGSELYLNLFVNSIIES